MSLWRMLQGILKKPQKADLVMFNAIGNHSPYAFQMISSILGTDCIKTTVEGLRQANSSDDDSVFCVQSFLKSQTKHDLWMIYIYIHIRYTYIVCIYIYCNGYAPGFTFGKRFYRSHLGLWLLLLPTSKVYSNDPAPQSTCFPKKEF